jgi:hypothetical protein
MAESNNSSNVAVVAIVVLVLLALVAGYFLFVGGGDDGAVIDVPEQIDVDVDTGGE